MRKIDTIIVHCSDTESGNAAAIRLYHINVRGWADIGYHYVILKDGTLELGRPLERAGAHCSGFNASSIGVCLIGKKVFSKAQFERLNTIVKELKAKFPIKKVAGHRDFPSAKAQDKTCPNFEVKDVLK